MTAHLLCTSSLIIKEASCVCHCPTDRRSSQNYLNIFMFLRFCALTFVCAVHSHYTVFKVLAAHFFRPSGPLVCDSLCIIALSPPFVNTFFQLFLPLFSVSPDRRFSLLPPHFFPLQRPSFSNGLSVYILKYIEVFSDSFRRFAKKGNTSQRTRKLRKPVS